MIGGPSNSRRGAATADLLFAAIQANDRAAIESAYSGSGQRPPSMLWGPGEADFTQPELRFLLGYWNRLRGDQLLPHQGQVDPVALRSVLGFVTWLEPIEDGRDFRYRIYGSKIANIAGFELTGKLVSEMPTAPIGIALLLAGHKAVMRRATPMKSVHEPATQSNTMEWTRLVLPFGDDGGQVSRLMVGNIPGDRRLCGGKRLPQLYPDFL